jgi:hypothetical protein
MRLYPYGDEGKIASLDITAIDTLLKVKRLLKRMYFPNKVQYVDKDKVEQSLAEIKQLLD